MSIVTVNRFWRWRSKKSIVTILSTMPLDLLPILLVVIFGFGFIGWIVNKRLSDLSVRQKPPDELLEIIKMLQTGSKEDRQVLLESLQRNTQSLNERLDNAARVINQVQRGIGEMSEIGRGIKDLQEFLRSPKLRGNVGEQVLKELLGQMLPKQAFNLQYTFKSGVTVDAAITTTAGIIPIDSKFPLENFRKMASSETEAEKKSIERDFVKDVKKHIDDISKKYILTDEGTLDYALMYIPSEAVYYEIMTSESGVGEYAHDKRVLPVSPTTFYAYLRAILMSFEGQKIEAKAKEILVSIRAIQKDYGKVEENLGVLGRHLNNAHNMLALVSNGFAQLGQKITSTQSLGDQNQNEVEKISIGS